MENFNEINSYNSLTMSPSKKKEIRVSTSYRTTKRNIGNELAETLRKNEINPFKRVSIELSNSHQEKNNFKFDKNFSNIQDISSTKEEDSSTGTISKFPKIQKHLTSSNSNSIKDSNQLFSLSNNLNNYNSSTSNILYQKDSSMLNNNNNSTNSTYYKSNSQKNNNYNYHRNYNNNNISSAHRIYNENTNYKNYNPLFPPADPLLKRTLVPKVNPRFGKMKAHITLPEFKGEEPITKFEYKPILKEMINTPAIEKQYEVSLYVNSIKMINNLIYLKTQLNKEGLISLDNLVNVKKLNKSFKNETEEEDIPVMSDNNLDNLNNNENNENNNNNDLQENINQNLENGDLEKNQNDNNNNNNNNNNQITKNNSTLNNKIQRPKTVYNELKPYYTLKNKNDNTLIFESRFESGNLLCAFRTEDENSYQLYLQNDTNTTGYIQWFFFRVSNTQKGRKVNFNIINMLRKKCIYNHGLKIMTYSIMAAAKENLGWHRECYNTIYYANNLYVYNTNNDKKRNLHSLSFDYEFKYDNDTVYFANCIPYFYSSLMKELNHYELNEEQYPYFHRKTLCTTLGGNDLDMLTINSMNDLFKNGIPSVITPKTNNYLTLKNNNENNNNNNSQIIDERKAVVIIGRQHPGETVGSYVVKGCMDFLMGNSDEAKKLREIYLFKIIPMMNPDGVLVGNSRTSFAGCDLNRRWGKPNEIIHPEIFNTKQMITKLATQRNIAFVIDCHGHFGTFNSLFYCNYKDDKRTCKLYPYICSRLSKIISFQQCTFSMPRYKLSTERISLFNELDDEDNDNIVALETSFFGINRSGEYSHFYFNSNLLKEIGRDICLGMLSYYYKCENMSIEVNFFSNKENIKKLDVDMREFESEIIREVNEDDEEIDLNNDEKSESEPSVDNLDKNQIMKLMPGGGKRRRRRKNKIKKFDKKNKNRDLDIELFNPIKEAAKRLEEEKRKKNKSSSKIVINCNIDKNKKIEKNQQPIFTDPNMKNAYTQTEEIFFKMHWSYFTGQYKILSSKSKIIPPNNNYFGLSQNLFGQFKNRNIFNNHSILNNKRHIDFINNNYNKFNGKINYNNNNLNVIRSKSLSNRMILSGKGTPSSNLNIKYNVNKNFNKSNIKNNYYNKIINDNKVNNIIHNENNDNNNEQNKEDNNNYLTKEENNIKLLKEKNELLPSNQIKNMEKSQYSTFAENKPKKEMANSYTKEINKHNIFNKTSTSFMNPFPAKQKKITTHKSNNNINKNFYKIISKNENGIANNVNGNNGENKFLNNKYNRLNSNKIYKENIKNKMAKSSTSFYKH